MESAVEQNNSNLMVMALSVLAVLSIVGGFIPLDLTTVLPSHATNVSTEPIWLHPLAIATPFIGVAFSWFYFKEYRSKAPVNLIEPTSKWSEFCRKGLGFDGLYQTLLVNPFCFIANLNRKDIFDQLLMFFAWYSKLCHDALSGLQNGQARWFAASIGLAALFLVGVFLL